MVTLPTTTYYWRPQGGADDAWTEAASGVFDPTDGSTVEVKAVGPSPSAFITALRSFASFAARSVTDASWSWHMRRSAIYDSARDRIYAGAVSIEVATGTPGTQWVLEFHGTTGEYLTRHNLGAFYDADDHNAPALWIEGGRLIVAFAGHDDAQVVKTARSTDTNPANFGATTDLTVSGAGTTYVQITKIGTTLYLATRSSPDEWKVMSNTAGGDPAEWSAAVSLMTSSGWRAYIAGRGTADGLAAIAWDHPTNVSSTNRGIIRVFVDADPMDGSVDLDTLPILYTPPSGDSSRVLSVNDDCTQFVYAKFTLPGGGVSTYHLARLTGTDRTTPADWTHEDLGITTQEPFWDISQYVSGAEVLGSGATETSIWVAYNTDLGHHFLEYWTRATSGDAWTKTPLAQSDKFMARPITVSGKNGAVLVQAFISYLNGVNGFNDWEMDAFVLTEPDADQCVFFPNPQFPGAPVFVDRFTATDGATLTGRTPDVGSGWSVVGQSPVITDNRVRFSGSGTDLALTPEATDADATVYGQMLVKSSFGSAYLVARSDATGDNMVFFGPREAGQSGRGFYLYETVSGVTTQLAYEAVGAYLVGRIMRLRMEFNGATVTCFDDTRQIFSATVSVTAAGRAGVRLRDNGNATGGFHIDDFGVK